jgi:hypothetical protein
MMGDRKSASSWRKRFQAQYFDFPGKSICTRFDGCEFVNAHNHRSLEERRAEFENRLAQPLAARKPKVE